MTLESRVQALLALVEADRARQANAILDRARSEVATIRRQAHAEARSRMRKAFAELRERSTARVAAARAALETQRRIAQQRRAQSLLAAALTQLPAALLARWHDPETRRKWFAAVAADGLAVLPRTSWRLVHPGDWPSAEREAFSAQLASQIGVPPQSVADPGIRAGLKIAAEGNIVDGTLDGLLADRYELGARLLRAIEAVS